MSGDSSVLAGLVRKLESRAPLGDRDRAAIMALPYVIRSFQSNAYIVREGEPPRAHCSLILSGFAFRQKLTTQGTRQILSLNMAGDLLDLQHLFLKQADHNVQALTRVEVADISREALQTLALGSPAIGKAMWLDTLIDASMFREWIVNVGRRDARARGSRIFCASSRCGWRWRGFRSATGANCP